MTIKTHGRMFTDNTVGITQLAITDGTDGQAIVTDGSGALRFATVGAGGAVGSSVYIEDTRTGNGVLTTFSLSTAAPYEESIMVFIDGIAQPTTAYTLPSTTSITFSSAPITGTTIRICHLGIASSVADNAITGAKIAMGADAAGDVLYYNGTDYQRLGIGTASQHLATNAAATAPEWVTGDGKLKISSNDTTSDYLVTKLTGGDGITLTETTQGGNETLDIDITDATVDSAMLKTSTEEESVSFSGAGQTLTFASAGSYGFYPQSKVNTGSKWFADAANPGASMPTTYTTVIEVQTHINPMTAFMQIRYVQASPPYNLGDGEVMGFIYAVIENGTGDIKRMHISQDPPWIYHPIHGINRSNVFFCCKARKKKIKLIDKVDLTKIENLDSFKNSRVERVVDFDNDVKMAAMNLCPHPYVDTVMKKLDELGLPVEDTSYWDNHHVALIDPMDATVKRLDEMRANGDESISLFHDGYLKIDNVDITNRKRPEGVQVYQAKWKNSK